MKKLLIITIAFASFNVFSAQEFVSNDAPTAIFTKITNNTDSELSVCLSKNPYQGFQILHKLQPTESLEQPITLLEEEALLFINNEKIGAVGFMEIIYGSYISPDLLLFHFYVNGEHPCIVDKIDIHDENQLPHKIQKNFELLIEDASDDAFFIDLIVPTTKDV
jgi:hypothetical protein